jgi:hypothetical protein
MSAIKNTKDTGMKRFFVFNKNTLCILNNNPEYRYCSQGLPEAPMTVYARKNGADHEIGESLIVGPSDFVRLATKSDFIAFEFIDFEMDKELTDAYKAQCEGPVYSDDALRVDMLSLSCEASLMFARYWEFKEIVSGFSSSAITMLNESDKSLSASVNGATIGNAQEANSETLEMLLRSVQSCESRTIQAQVLLREISRQHTHISKLDHDIDLANYPINTPHFGYDKDCVKACQNGLESDKAILLKLVTTFTTKAAEYQKEADRIKVISLH